MAPPAGRVGTLGAPSVPSGEGGRHGMGIAGEKSGFDHPYELRTDFTTS
jgi:hypothetical protein